MTGLLSDAPTGHEEVSRRDDRIRAAPAVLRVSLCKPRGRGSKRSPLSPILGERARVRGSSHFVTPAIQCSIRNLYSIPTVRDRKARHTRSA